MVHERRTYCAHCGAEFLRAPEDTWKRLCFDCWREQKAQQGGGSRSRHDSFTCERCFALGKAEGAAQASPALDKTRLRELLQLAHPDKHAGSPLAVRITQWLNEQRRAMQ